MAVNFGAKAALLALKMSRDGKASLHSELKRKIRRRANVRTRGQQRNVRVPSLISNMADSEARGGGSKKVDVLVRSRNVVRTTH